jgi:class 3 adenylate cyclase
MPTSQQGQGMPTKLAGQSGLQTLLTSLGLCTFYFLTAWLTWRLFYESDPSPIWPPAGIAIVVTYRYRLLGLISVAIGDILFDTLIGGTTGIITLLLACGFIGETFCGASLLRRSTNQLLRTHPRDYLGLFFLATFGATLINASFSVAALLLTQKLTLATAPPIWLSFWLGDSMGILVLAPLLLSWQQLWPSLRARGWEALACFGLILGLSLLIFQAPTTSSLSHYRAEYLPFLLMIWAALRFHLSGAALASFLIGIIAILGAKNGLGPFTAQTANFATAVLALQGFLVFLTVTALTVASAEIQLRRSEYQRANLSRYFAPGLVEELASNPIPLGKDQTGQAVILYADITGFSALIETMSPEHTLETLRQFQQRMEAKVFEYQGTLERYTGDGLVAVFGAPRQGQRDATNALACARAMRKELQVYNGHRAMAGQPPLLVGIGMDYGRVIMGNVGSERCLTFMVAGKPAKIAIRLKDLCTRYQADIFISKAVQERVMQESGSESILLRDFVSMGKQGLLGLTNPIMVLGLPSPEVEPNQEMGLNPTPGIDQTPEIDLSDTPTGKQHPLQGEDEQA